MVTIIHVLAQGNHLTIIYIATSKIVYTQPHIHRSVLESVRQYNSTSLVHPQMFDHVYMTFIQASDSLVTNLVVAKGATYV